MCLSVRKYTVNGFFRMVPSTTRSVYNSAWSVVSGALWLCSEEKWIRSLWSLVQTSGCAGINVDIYNKPVLKSSRSYAKVRHFIHLKTTACSGHESICECIYCACCSIFGKHRGAIERCKIDQTTVEVQPTRLVQIRHLPYPPSSYMYDREKVKTHIRSPEI